MFDTAAPNVEFLTHDRVTWAYVERPTPTEADYLQHQYGLHPTHLAECLARSRRPTLVEQPDYLYLSLDVPIYNKLARSTSSGAVGIFLGPDYLVTVHHGEARPLVRLFRECQSSDERRAEVLAGGPGYLLYTVVDRLLGQCAQVAEALAADVRAAEESLLTEEDRGLLQEIAYLRRDVTVMRGFVHPQVAALADLVERAGRSPLLASELVVYLASLAGQMAQLAESLDSASETVAALVSIASSLAARRAHDAARLVAILSATTMPLLVATTLFGVGVRELPLAEHPYGFEVILAGLAVIALAALYLLRRGRWL